MGLSIAATWIWAPALFVAAQQSYLNGFWGLFWFTVPNVLALIVFGRYALRFRERIPEGFTLSGYMKERYSRRVQGAYHVQLLIQDVAAFAVQLVAGGAIIAGITGWPYLWIIVGMTAIVLAYSLTGGLRASIFTDHLQMLIIVVVMTTVSAWIFIKSGGFSTIAAGLSGMNSPNPWLFILSFGIPTSIALLSGPFGFSGFWQRGLAQRNPQDIKRAYHFGAAVFAIIPLSLGLIGLAAAGSNLAVENVQLTNLTAIQEWLPAWVVIPFTIAILMGLMSTLDSALSGTSTMWGHDWSKRFSPKKARLGMLAVGGAAIGIALIPGITILYLLFFYGTSRAATMMPTILTLSKGKIAFQLTERGMFYGVICGLLFGAPVMIYGQATQQWGIGLIGSLCAVGLSGGIAYALRDRSIHV